ncbi:hypothetical protein SUGI_0328780 [Cryptomeria japonica]|uniref:peroxidase 11 n=1 Tax=Cryptomeria japonica TaxID=3369 RepID=UPI002408E7C8|nr:peroxidase 11 [Cryptomeria japonica]GLJ18509.1 hypothetical protein SUGI_0328780 [Cryptomeria japonica]
MAESMSVILLLLVLTSYKMSCLHAQDLPILMPHYYEKSCPCAFPIIRNEMHLALLKDPRMAASLLRLQFHDCFVQGCDASLLLDDTPTLRGEKTANANINSARGFDVIDLIKTKLESECPGVVSCADIITIAARDAVLLSGGPYWEVSLGRKDSSTASFNDANNNIPTPNSNLQTLITSFQKQGLSTVDMVALLGGHTIGNARCQNIRPRIYNNSASMAFSEPHLSMVKAACPPSGNDNGVWPLDFPTPILFDNSYYINLVRGLGLLNSDQTLYSEGSETKEIVESYAHDPLGFWKQFSESMVKMSNIVDPLTFVTGEVRKNCRTVNDPL